MVGKGRVEIEEGEEELSAREARGALDEFARNRTPFVVLASQRLQAVLGEKNTLDFGEWDFAFRCFGEFCWCFRRVFGESGFAFSGVGTAISALSFLNLYFLVFRDSCHVLLLLVSGHFLLWWSVCCWSSLSTSRSNSPVSGILICLQLPTAHLMI